jgi:hypothetical protein
MTSHQTFFDLKDHPIVFSPLLLLTCILISCRIRHDDTTPALSWFWIVGSDVFYMQHPCNAVLVIKMVYTPTRFEITNATSPQP